MISETMFSDLVGLIYEAGLDSTKWNDFLQRAAEVFGSHTANIHFQHTESAAVSAILNMDDPYVRSYCEHFAALNPFMKRTDVQQEGRAYVRRELVSTRDLVETEFYNDWARPQGFDDFVCGTMIRRGPVAGNITFWRRKEAHPCGEDEVRTLALFMPHLVRAMQIHQRISGVERKCEALAKALDLLGHPLLLLDLFGKVVMMNSAAAKLIQRNEGLRVRHDRLEADRPAESSAIRRAVQAAAQCAKGKVAPVPEVIPIPRGENRRALLVWVAPLVAGGVLDEQRPLVATFVIDPGARAANPGRVLGRVFGLTSAETRLALALLDGEDLTSAAESFGVTRNTVRTQLQAIFAKTGTSRQGELMRMLAQLVPINGEY